MDSHIVAMPPSAACRRRRFERSADLEVMRLDGTGHFLMMEKPDEFNRVLGGFLDRIGY